LNVEIQSVGIGRRFDWEAPRAGKFQNRGKMVIGLVILMILPPGGALEWVPMAYVDPGTGGMLFQVLAALFAVLSGVIFFFSRQIKTMAARAQRYVGERWRR
jgi:hypothetical protein